MRVKKLINFDRNEKLRTIKSFFNAHTDEQIRAAVKQLEGN